MNELSNYLVETFLLTEAVKEKVVVFGGRFQPFHAGHYKTYKHLCSVFGAKNVYIATSNVQDSNKSPLSFNDKRDIAVKVFGIPPSKFIQVKSPYQPVEILRDFNDTTTALIIALGEKDAMRLGGQYFKPYKNDKDMEGYLTRGYVYSKNPSNAFGATDVRNMFRSNLSADEKEKQFQKFFGKYNKDVFQMLNKQLNEAKEFIPGGLSKGMTLAQIADKHKVDLDTLKKEFKKGVNVEMEHTTDIRVAAEIARDHIFEDPKYYDKLMTIEGDIDYEPNAINWENIMNMEIADPATGKKYRIKDAIKLDRKEFAYQEAMRVLHVHAMMDQRQVPGNIEKGQASPKSDKVNQVNLGLYTGYGEGIVKEASVKGSGYSPQILNQMVKNPKTGEDIKVSSALNYDRDHPAYKAAMMLVAKAGGSDKQKLQKVKQKVQRPTFGKGGEKVKDTSASATKVAQTAVSNPKLVARAIGQKIAKWSKAEREFFRGPHKAQSQERRSVGEWMASKAKGIVAGVKREAIHLGHEVKDAAGGIKALFAGEKLNDHQKKALITMGKTIGMTVGSMILTGGASALLHHGAGTIMAHLGTHLAEHMAGEVALMGIGKAALHAGKEDESDDKYIEWFVLQLADNMVNGEIPAYVWEKALDDYNKDKEAGKVSEKDWTGPNELKEMAKVDMDKVEKYADSQLSPEDIVLGKETDHFFQRLNDPRNGKEISPAELTGFFKRLAKNKKKFLEFIKKYNEFVVKDKRTGINIPFMVQANKLIAKTIMRKDDFKSSTPVYTTEQTLTEDEEVGSIQGSYFNGDWDAYPDQAGIGASTNSTTGTEHNTAWDAYDAQGYYTDNLPGWEVNGHLSDSLSDEIKNKVLPIFNHGEENGQHNHTIQKITAPNEAMKQKVISVKGGINEGKLTEIARGIFGGTIKIGGQPVKIEVELVGADNKTREFITKVVHIDSKYFKQLPIGSTFRIPARIFRAPGGGWYKVKHNAFESVNESLLLEGGAYGHMNHPFDTSINLTFKDLKTIVTKALDGNLGVVREKTDGQALAISWKNGRLIAARNKSHLANAGEGALDASGIANKFANRGGLTDAYNFAMKDLESALRGLGKADLDKIFQNGKVFMNLEVIFPTSVNVIPYGQSLLVFHNAVEYNEAGNAIGVIKGAESKLGSLVKKVNGNVQSKYTIQGPPITKLPKNDNLSSLKPKYLSQISKLQSEFGLSDNAGVADYHQAWWKDYIKKSGKKLEPLEIEGLVKRWAFDDKSFRLNTIADEKARVWADGIEKQSKSKIAKENLMKFEEIFLGVGSDVLSFMSSVLTASPDTALQQMRSKLDSAISTIRATGDASQIAKLELELQRLNSIGGFDKIVPNEGIIFNYKGNVFKMTGAFASLNQLLGILYH